jgi:biotin carboxyl carrier protein
VSDGEGGCVVEVSGERHLIAIEEEARHLVRARSGAAAGDGARTVRAPMPGRVTHVPVGVGDAVAPGDTLVVVEAMKMENELRASAPGTVREVRVEAGQAVNAGDVLVVVE